jgi:hypothetical protein
MADLDGLRKRVEQIDLRLKTAHRAREKEGVALMDMWERIRERFVDQNSEITELRSRVADLEDTRDDLLQMVHGLLSAVEGGLERMSDETVPRIKAMANSLLDGDRASPAARPALDEDEAPPDYQVRQEADDTEEETVGTPNFHDDLLSAIEKSIENVRGGVTPTREMESEAAVLREPARNADKPASPGIRDLVARIENAVGPEFLDTSSGADEDELAEDDLSRDLREIEALRGELNGLRERISSGR